MRRTVSLTLTIAMVAGFAVINNVTAADAESSDAMMFTLTAHDGSEVSLADHKDKVVVLEWFCDTCPASKAHHKDGSNTMVDLASKYAGKGVVWLAINSTGKHDVEHNAKAASKMGISYPILDDSAGTVGKAYGARTTPHMFIVKDGKVVYNGAIDDRKETNYVDVALTEILAGKTVTTPKTRSYGCGVKYKR